MDGIGSAGIRVVPVGAWSTAERAGNDTAAAAITIRRFRRNPIECLLGSELE
jgi:hypothetical protein